MCGSIREFGFKIPVLARSDGEVVDGHLRLKAARKLGSWPGGDTTAIPVILCDEWTPAQVKAFRLMVNRSVTWADWDEELLALELQELSEADFDLSLTGFDPREIDDLLRHRRRRATPNAAPPFPENPVSRARRPVALRNEASAPGALRRCDQRGGRGAAAGRAQAAADGHRPAVRNRARFASGATAPGLNGCGAGRASYMKHRTEGHTETTISGDTRADWSEAFELVPSLAGRLRLARIEVHARGARRPAADRLPAPPADHLEQGPDGAHAHALLVSA